MNGKPNCRSDDWCITESHSRSHHYMASLPRHPGSAMNELAQSLAALNPPLYHAIDLKDDGYVLKLTDNAIPATVVRYIENDAARTPAALNIIILYAVNELRLKGSHVPLQIDTELVSRPLQLPNIG